MSAALPGGNWGAIVRRLAALPRDHRRIVLMRLTKPERRRFFENWSIWAHGGQVPPDSDWHVWLIRAGRGFGKTRAGAEWVSAFARSRPDARIALVGGTRDDVHKVMIEGQSGLTAVAHAGESWVWRPHSDAFEFSNGARAFVFSAEAPEKLRGPEHHAAWCDEVAKWRRGDAAWDNLMLGLRLGDRPRVVVTTTPRAVHLMRRILVLRGLVESRGTTHDNPHLPESFMADMAEMYGGTRLGRQEIDGEMIDDVEGALWTRAMLEGARVAAMPGRTRVVVGVDPPAGVGHDACGIVAVALGADEVAYVIEDASVEGATPEGWAKAVAECARRHRADRVIAESNQGGAMVKSVLLAHDAGLPVALVHAAKGKVARAEPVAALYENGRAKHLGVFPKLEDELCGLIMGGGMKGPGGRRTGRMRWCGR